ncbi:MAG: hypothetical protein GX639_11250 [Fibrobacter sp.]|nr:hypothetical protein [Fibrobacter sp.]
MWVRLLTISSVFLSLMLLVCKLPAPPPGPENAFVALEFKSSTGKIAKDTLTDSTGKQVKICMIHNLTQYIDSSTLKITKGTEFNEVHQVRSFRGQVDTTYYPIVFSYPGSYAVIFVGYIEGQPTVLNGTITIVAREQTIQNHKPILTITSPSKDTVVTVDFCEIKVTCVHDSGCLVKGYRDGIAFDMDKSLSVDNLWTGIAKGIIAGNYSTIKIVATDSSTAKNKDSVSVKIKYDGDTSSPVLTRLNPATESASTNSSSYTITITCNDSSGVLSVNAALGSKSFTGTRGTGTTWTIPVEGLLSGAANTVVVTAVDSSMRANKSMLNYAITFDPTMLDTIGPTITPVSGPVSGTTVTTPTVDLVVNVSDPNNVDSVYWTKNSGTKKMMTPVTGKTGQYSLNEILTEGKIDTLTLVAIDKATRHNQTKLTITLKYSEPRYSIIYNGNTNTGGTAPTDPGAYVQGAKVTVAKAGALVKDGYTFTGWNTMANGTGTACAAESSFDMGSANVTLYAQWTLIPTFTVTYNANTSPVAGSVPVDETAYTEGSLVIVKGAGSLSKTGLEIVGWSTLANGTGTSYTSGASFKIGAANVTLYAKWSIKKCQISFNAHGGTVPESQTADYGNLVVEPSSKYSGFTLVGWYSEPECTNKWNFLTQTVSNSVTLHAKWVVKDIDGNVYDTVRIGSQTWMVQNLKTTKYNDGTPIPYVSDSADWANSISSAYCWPDGNTSNGAVYGALYNQFAARSVSIAPFGWHVPSKVEWDTLCNYLIFNGYSYNGSTTENFVAQSMAGKTGWFYSSDEGTPGYDTALNNKSGFTALPAGARSEDGNYGLFGETCVWWSTTQIRETLYWTPTIGYNGTYFLTGMHYFEKSGYSIRCIKNP